MVVSGLITCECRTRQVSRSSLAEVHKKLCPPNPGNEVDGQEEGQDDKRDGGEQRDEIGVVEERAIRHNAHLMRMKHEMG